MNNISTIFGIMHKFKPEIQGDILAFLKNNHSLLKQKYGFIKLPELLSAQKKMNFFEEGLLSEGESVRNIISSTLLEQLPKLNDANARNFINLYFSAYESLLSKYLPSTIKSFGNNFFTNKSKIVNLFRQYPDLQKLAIKMEKENSPKKFFDLMMEWQAKISKDVNKKYLAMTKKSVPLESQQLVYNTRIQSGNIQLELQKILCQPTTDKRVLAIEKLLKDKYNMEYVNLYNIEEAQNALKAIEIAVQNNVPLPKNYIVTPYINAGGFNQISTNGEHTVYINPTLKEKLRYITPKLPKSGNKDIDEATNIMRMHYELNANATQNPLQLHMHEIIHDEMKFMQIMNEKAFTEKERLIIQDVSTYAAICSSGEHLSREEVRTELKTKKLLEHITEKQQAILDVLS